MIVAVYKMYTTEIIIKSQIFDIYENLVRPEKLETKNILIDEKSYKGLVIYFNRYEYDKSITVISLYYHKLI